MKPGKQIHLDGGPNKMVIFPNIRGTAGLAQLIKRKLYDLEMLIGT